MSTLEEIEMLWKLYADEKYSNLFKATVEEIGKLTADAILSLQRQKVEQT